MHVSGFLTLVIGLQVLIDSRVLQDSPHRRLLSILPITLTFADFLPICIPQRQEICRGIAKVGA